MVMLHTDKKNAAVASGLDSEPSPLNRHSIELIVDTDINAPNGSKPEDLPIVFPLQSEGTNPSVLMNSAAVAATSMASKPITAFAQTRTAMADSSSTSTQIQEIYEFSLNLASFEIPTDTTIGFEIRVVNQVYETADQPGLWISNTGIQNQTAPETGMFTFARSSLGTLMLE